MQFFHEIATKGFYNMQINANAFPNTDLVVWSHLRWDFVFQRPQHILSRFADQMEVFYIEEPVEDNERPAHYTLTQRTEQLTVVVPHLPGGLSPLASLQLQRQLFAAFMKGRALDDLTFWYYTPMALPFTRDYTPAITVFDCMDELSAFRFAPQELKELETELLKRADIAFTGGQSLYEAKKTKHANIHAFPSSIDKLHFAQSRQARVRKKSRHFTLAFYGVIDERFDMELIRHIAICKPLWDIVLIGPVVKIELDTLPSNANIHFIGPKTYEELPQLISGWDVALIPFLLNESTRFISPTKTPEYLAAGLPVISTPIRDVVYPYGAQELVMIGRNAQEFIAYAEQVEQTADKKAWLQQVDLFLSNISWDYTCEQMLTLIGRVVKPAQQSEPFTKTGSYV